MTSPRPAATGRRDVLVVNARADGAWAGWAVDVLRESGRSAGMLQDGLRNFLDVRQVIERELRAAGQVVVLLSNAGAPFLTTVVSVANDLGTRVVPVHLDEQPAPYPRALAHFRAVDLTNVPLEAAGERLLSAVDGSFEHRVRANHLRRRPPSPDPFVGRENDLERLHRAFFGGSRAAVVAGPKGVGKSALAAQFVRSNRDRWANALWTSPTRFAEDQLRLLTRPHRPSLLVVDGADEYRTVKDAMWPVLLDRDLVNVLVTSSSTEWPEPFRVVELEPLDHATATRLVDRALPGLAPGDAGWVADAVGDNPAAVTALAGLGAGSATDVVAEFSGLLDVARAVGSEDRGFYYLESRDPRIVGAFERAFVDLGEVELLTAGKGPWRRWWRRRCAPRLRVDAVVRLTAASRSVSRAVFTVGPRVFVKAADELGPNIVSRTLSAGELSDFDLSQRLRLDPVAEVLGVPGHHVGD